QRTFDGANHAVLLKHLGEKVNIITKIDTVYIADAALFIFLNGESVGDKSFKLVIWSEEILALQAQGRSIHSNGIRFENMDYQWISVTGILSVHKGNPQVTLENPNQLQLLKDAVTAQNRLNSLPKKSPMHNKLPQKFEKPISEEAFWSEYLDNQKNLPPSAWYIPPSGTATPVNHPTNNVNNVKVSKWNPISTAVISVGSLVGGFALAAVFQNALFVVVGFGIGIYTIVRD
ncbi:MAG: hypothetical protein RLZZ628_4404, partial [Bacteroidota bacterium]